jgi:hypothetical protein
MLDASRGLANALPEDATLDTLLDWFGMRQHMQEAIPEHEPGTKTMYHYLTYCWLWWNHYMLQESTMTSIWTRLSIMKLDLYLEDCHRLLATTISHLFRP